MRTAWKPPGSASRARRPRRLRPPRRVALVGGPTSTGDVLRAAGCLLTPGRLLDGPSIRTYEEAFARAVGTRYAFSFDGGRVALYAILQALGIGEGDEVLLQVPTHVVVANAIRYTGARPVFVDCHPPTCNTDLASAKARASPQTRAIVVQHTFGVATDLDPLMEWAGGNDIEVIEDCVHALGSRYRGRMLGSFGRAAIFSTEETKTISTTVGGMAVTDDPDLAAHLQRFQRTCAWPSVRLTLRRLTKLIVNHLFTEPRVHPYTRLVYEIFGRRNPLPGPLRPEERVGGRPEPYAVRLSNAQAQLGLRQLRRLHRNLAHREAISAAYDARLTALGFTGPRPMVGDWPPCVRFPVFVGDTRAVARAVAPHAVVGRWFSSVLEGAVDPAYGGYETGSCPRAEAVAGHLANLPTHERVTLDDVEAVVRAIAASAEPIAVPGMDVQAGAS